MRKGKSYFITLTGWWKTNLLAAISYPESEDAFILQENYNLFSTESSPKYSSILSAIVSQLGFVISLLFACKSKLADKKNTRTEL